MGIRTKGQDSNLSWFVEITVPGIKSNEEKVAKDEIFS